MDDDALRRFVSQHDIIYEVPPRFWEDGFPIGNGHFGGMVWQPDGIEIGLNKLDVWDRRVEQPDKVPFDRLKELFDTDPEQAQRELQGEREVNPDFPFPKPLGRLKIDIEHEFLPLYQSVFCQTQRLRLYDGAVRCRYETNYKATTFDCLVDPEANLLIVSASDGWLHPSFSSSQLRQKVTILREYDETLGMPETGAQDDTVWVRYPFPDGFEYVLAMTIEGAEHTDPVLFTNEASMEVLLDYGDQQPKSWHVLVTAATSLDAANPRNQALDNLQQARQDTVAARSDHTRRWWHGFWGKSGVEFDDRFVESLWYVSLYQLACTSRGKTAPGLCGLYNMMKSPPWHGDYHGDINMVMTYWGIFGSNHIELGEPYFETFSKLLPIAKQQTADTYGIDGAKYPIATLDTGVELTGGHYRIMQCTSGFYALVFWSRWLYEQDLEVLKNQVFPVLQESSKFYLGIAQERDGVLHFGPSWAPEQGPFPCYNSTNDTALIKACWEAYIQACRILRIDNEWLSAVTEGLEKFPPYPEKDGRFLDSYTTTDHIGLNHPGLLAMVVPGNEVDSDHALRPTALRTMEAMFDVTVRRGFEGRRSFCCDLTWPWMVAVAAKLGAGDLADEYLFNMGVRENLKPNGMFSLNCCATYESLADKRAAFTFQPDVPRHGAIFWCPTSQEGRERYFQFIQAPGGVLYATTEMLLQSHGGVIRVFPAVPSRLEDCAFRGLLAEGGFEVSARMAGRGLEYVVVESKHGGRCAVNMPEERTWWVSDGTGKSAATTGRTVTFDTSPGGAYVIAPGPRSSEVDTSLRAGSQPGVKTFRDGVGQSVTLGKTKSGCQCGPPGADWI